VKVAPESYSAGNELSTKQKWWVLLNRARFSGRESGFGSTTADSSRDNAALRNDKGRRVEFSDAAAEKNRFDRNRMLRLS
jgi:hypothetical protein